MPPLPTHFPWRRCRPRRLTVFLATTLALSATLPSTARAQTDYYNTDAGRPVRIEDAYTLERRGFEL